MAAPPSGPTKATKDFGAESNKEVEIKREKKKLNSYKYTLYQQALASEGQRVSADAIRSLHRRNTKERALRWIGTQRPKADGPTTTPVWAQKPAME